MVIIIIIIIIVIIIIYFKISWHWDTQQINSWESPFYNTFVNNII